MSPGPVVVAVLSHRDPAHLRRLVDRVLEGRRTVVLVHHDPRGRPHGLTIGPRVRVVPFAQPCHWGRIDLADAMLRCLRAGVEQVPDLEWLLLVSGQDYPAQSLQRTEAALAATDADALLRWFAVGDPADDQVPWQARCRVRYLRRRRLPGSHRSIPWPRRHPFGDGLRLYVGDMWVNLRRTAVDHVLAQADRLPAVREHLATCSVPDEALLPTLLLNDADHLRVDADRHRFIRWTDGEPHPAVLGVGDLEAVRDSGDFFARKVEPAASAALLDGLDEAAATDG